MLKLQHIIADAWFVELQLVKGLDNYYPVPCPFLAKPHPCLFILLLS